MTLDQIRQELQILLLKTSFMSDKSIPEKLLKILQALQKEPA